MYQPLSAHILDFPPTSLSKLLSWQVPLITNLATMKCLARVLPSKGKTTPIPGMFAELWVHISLGELRYGDIDGIMYNPVGPQPLDHAHPWQEAGLPGPKALEAQREQQYFLGRNRNWYSDTCDIIKRYFKAP